MRVPTEAVPDQPLTYIWERHREIARRLVAGEKPIEIARAMNYTPGRVSVIMHSPAFKEVLLDLRKQANENAADVRGRISQSAIRAMDILEAALAEKPPEGITLSKQVSIAQDMLDRAGHGAVQKSLALTGALDSNDLDEIKKRKQTMRVVGEGHAQTR